MGLVFNTVPLQMLKMCLLQSEKSILKSCIIHEMSCGRDFSSTRIAASDAGPPDQSGQPALIKLRGPCRSQSLGIHSSSSCHSADLITLQWDGQREEPGA